MTLLSPVRGCGHVSVGPQPPVLYMLLAGEGRLKASSGLQAPEVLMRENQIRGEGGEGDRVLPPPLDLGVLGSQMKEEILA